MGFVRLWSYYYSPTSADLYSAFGGMVAFCIIVGDTIPHVVMAVFPSFQDSHFLWLFTDRRAVIVIFIMGISYPFSLYRDIAKVSVPLRLLLDTADRCLSLPKRVLWLFSACLLSLSQSSLKGRESLPICAAPSRDLCSSTMVFSKQLVSFRSVRVFHANILCSINLTCHSFRLPYAHKIKSRFALLT